MIYVTGDIHGDPRRFNTECFPEQNEMTKDDFMIILGDFGIIWGDSKEEKYWLDWLDKKPFTTLFIDGNHENFNLLYEYPEVDFHGGKAHKIRNSIYHLMRGYVFDICDKKFFAFGGAQSHDIKDGIFDTANYTSKEQAIKEYNKWRKECKQFRVKGLSWWEQELPTNEETIRGIKSLEAVNYEVDFVISHCAPQDVASLMGYRESDILTQYFSCLIEDGLKFNRWIFGHYHDNKQIMSKFILLYEQIIRIA